MPSWLSTTAKVLLAAGLGELAFRGGQLASGQPVTFCQLTGDLAVMALLSGVVLPVAGVMEVAAEKRGPPPPQHPPADPPEGGEPQRVAESARVPADLRRLTFSRDPAVSQTGGVAAAAGCTGSFLGLIAGLVWLTALLTYWELGFLMVPLGALLGLQWATALRGRGRKLPGFALAAFTGVFGLLGGLFLKVPQQRFLLTRDALVLVFVILAAQLLVLLLVRPVAAKTAQSSRCHGKPL